MAEHKKGILQKKVDKQIYEVSSGNDRITYVPHYRGERIKALKVFVVKECEKAWKQLPREIATLKRVYLNELVDGLV